MIYCREIYGGVTPWLHDDPREMVAKNPIFVWEDGNYLPDSHYYTAFKGNVDMFETISQANFLQRPAPCHKRKMRLHAFEACSDKNPDYKWDRSCTPAHFAAERGYLKCLAFLVKYAPLGGAILEVRDEKGDTPAHFATRTGCIQSLEFIRNNAYRGANALNFPNKEGYTPVHEAFYPYDLPTLKYLLENVPNGEAALDVPFANGSTLVDLALIYESPEPLEFLVRNSPRGIGVLSEWPLHPYRDWPPEPLRERCRWFNVSHKLMYNKEYEARFNRENLKKMALEIEAEKVKKSKPYKSDSLTALILGIVEEETELKLSKL